MLLLVPVKSLTSIHAIACVYEAMLMLMCTMGCGYASHVFFFLYHGIRRLTYDLELFVQVD